jgi:transposase-like protein
MQVKIYYWLDSETRRYRYEITKYVCPRCMTEYSLEELR